MGAPRGLLHEPWDTRNGHLRGHSFEVLGAISPGDGDSFNGSSRRENGEAASFPISETNGNVALGRKKKRKGRSRKTSLCDGVPVAKPRLDVPSFEDVRLVELRGNVVDGKGKGFMRSVEENGFESVPHGESYTTPPAMLRNRSHLIRSQATPAVDGDSALPQDRDQEDAESTLDSVCRRDAAAPSECTAADMVDTFGDAPGRPADGGCPDDLLGGLVRVSDSDSILQEEDDGCGREEEFVLRRDASSGAVGAALSSTLGGPERQASDLDRSMAVVLVGPTSNHAKPPPGLTPASLKRKDLLCLPLAATPGSPGSTSTPNRAGGGGALSTVGTPRLTDWERIMEVGPVQVEQPLDLSPLNFLARELGAPSGRMSGSPVNDLRRERVYNTMFHVPWRCELLIGVGVCVCLDSFLAMLTVMPLRILRSLWTRMRQIRLLIRPSAEELVDVCCLVVLVLGVALLQQAEIGSIYHWIRGQAIIKLYVVFNVLEIIDKLCQSFGCDVLQVLQNSAHRVAQCPPERLPRECLRLALDQGVALVCYLLHALVIMSQAITLNVAVNSHNNALLTLLVSNNFVEIKGNVFKRLSKDYLHKMAYLDVVERFHIGAHLIFVMFQNIASSREPWCMDFFLNAGMVVLCEIMVDAVKHAFLAKFNEIKPGAYSSFLQSLCRQTLANQSQMLHKTLSFVPLAPACVVLRILVPLFVSALPVGPPWWRWGAGLLMGSLLLLLLTILRVMVGLGLQLHARWYLKRCLKKGKQHAD